MNFAKVFLAVAATALLVTGCARQKDEATKALTSIETSVSALQEDGMKYAPVAYEGVQSTLGMLKDSLAKEDYKSVMAGTPELNKAVDSLKSAIASGKEQFTAAAAEWSSMSADVPKMVEAIQSRVDILASSKKLPKNVSKDALESAKSGLEWMKTTWAEATAAAADKPSEAVEKAKAVKAKGAEVLAALGMSGPAAA
jgi:chromosome segregation ATPase